MNSELKLSGQKSWPLEGTLTVEVTVAAPRGWLRNAEHLEATAGVTATMILGIAPVILGAIVSVALLNEQHPLLATICAALTLLGAGLATLVGAVCLQAVRACFPEWSDDPTTQLQLKPDELDRFHPASSFAIETALSLPRFPRWLQPVVSGWWLLHFLGGALSLMALHSVAGGNLPETIIGGVLLTAFHFVFLLGANLYLLLAASALTTDEYVLHRIWGCRFLVDLILTVVLLLFAT